MKKFSLALLCLAALFVACASAPGASGSSGGRGDTPEWLNEFPPEDAMWGIGAAKQSTESLSMTMAEARARQSIAQQLSTRARGMITDFARDAGSGASQSSTQLAEAVSRQLTEAELTGATPIRRWKGPDGTWWYLVQYPKAEAAKTAAGVVDTEAARYAEFKAMDALRMMDAELAASREKAVPVTE
jgi:GH24 family phage-related lysozyme (muramidase)